MSFPSLFVGLLLAWASSPGVAACTSGADCDDHNAATADLCLNSSTCAHVEACRTDADCARLPGESKPPACDVLGCRHAAADVACHSNARCRHRCAVLESCVTPEREEEEGEEREEKRERESEEAGFCSYHVDLVCLGQAHPTAPARPTHAARWAVPLAVATLAAAGLFLRRR